MGGRGESERVVVTGIGSVNALAPNVPGFAAALRRGDCGIGPLTLFDTAGFRTHNGAEVRNFVPRQAIPAGFSLKRMSRADLFALAAACEALARANLQPFPAVLAEETGVVIGGGAGGLLEAEEFFRDYLLRGGLGGGGAPRGPRARAPPAPHPPPPDEI